MDLEVQVGWGRERVSSVTDEPDDVPGMNVPAVQCQGRVAGEMGVVELVSVPVAHPEPPAPEVLPADPVHRSVCDGDDGSPDRGEEVVAVVPASRDVAEIGRAH